MTGKRSTFEDYFDQVPIKTPYWQTNTLQNDATASGYSEISANDKSLKLYRDLVFSQDNRQKTAQILKSLDIFEVSSTLYKGFDVKPYTPPSPNAASHFFSTSATDLHKATTPSKFRGTPPSKLSLYNVEQTMERINMALAKIAATPYYDSIKEQRKKASVESEELLRKDKLRVSLPSLPANVKDLLREARHQPEHVVITEKFSIPIGSKEFKRLVSPHWLNDEVINAYLIMIQRRSEENSSKLPSVHSFNTHFYTTLCDRGYEAVQRWTRRTDLFAKDIVFVPVHLGMHWVLSVIDFRHKVIRYLDSLHGNNEKALRILKNYLEQEHLDKKKAPFDFNGWTFTCEKNCPAQQNGFDCGVFTCVNAEFLSRNAELSFGQKEMLYFRDKIAYELLTESLL